MTVRVRLAPSPTGLLHVGTARTALYNYLYAKCTGGKFILRVEDTDLERSKREYEESQLNDLKWLGMDYDEGPEKPGEFGPYRQSERGEIYKKYGQELIDKGLAYYCFCTAEELEAKKEALEKKKEAPVYDGKCRSLSRDEANQRLKGGEQATIRFKVPDKDFSFDDKVRKHVVFKKGMVGDFVIMRSSGMPVYNFCCVVDDWLMKISHVIRGEDHLSNTLRQLMIYEAFDVEPPIFVHLPLIVGDDRQKLSKRHGATSVSKYKEDSYLPEAIVNYLCLLGWSHPDEKDIFDQEELKKVFNLDRFSVSPAAFDLTKLNWINGQHLRNLSSDILLREVSSYIDDESQYHLQSEDWKKSFLELFKEKILFFSELNKHLDDLFSSDFSESEGLQEIFSWETTPKIAKYLSDEIYLLSSQGLKFVSRDHFDNWSNHIKKELKIKGKFLFKGMRGVLTGMDQGADLKTIVILTPIDILLKRSNKIG